MTLPASGEIGLHQIASEFGIATNSVFPTAFYGLGGAPGSGALSFSDFYGRSGSAPITSDKAGITATGFSDSDVATITATGGRTIASFSLISGAAGGRITLGATGGTSTTITVSTPGSGNGSVTGIYRVIANDASYCDVSFDANWGIA